MGSNFIIGYDPGGNSAHGVAALSVREERGRWVPVSLLSLQVKERHTLAEASNWLEKSCEGGRIVAAGIDTLTEWSAGPSGWRPADAWLRKNYPEMPNSVCSSNSMRGSMAVNGAAFLNLFAQRFRADRTMVTEAHPKVCYFAMTKLKNPEKPERHIWTNDSTRMAQWVINEIGVDQPSGLICPKDHCFDASVAVLAALRGINREWPTDLHHMLGKSDDARVLFCGKTHFWWPDEI